MILGIALLVAVAVGCVLYQSRQPVFPVSRPLPPPSGSRRPSADAELRDLSSGYDAPVWDLAADAPAGHRAPVWDHTPDASTGQDCDTSVDSGDSGSCSLD